MRGLELVHSDTGSSYNAGPQEPKVDNEENAQEPKQVTSLNNLLCLYLYLVDG
jgi:hypothetical protein